MAKSEAVAMPGRDKFVIDRRLDSLAKWSTNRRFFVRFGLWMDEFNLLGTRTVCLLLVAVRFNLQHEYA